MNASYVRYDINSFPMCLLNVVRPYMVIAMLIAWDEKMIFHGRGAGIDGRLWWKASFA